MYQRRSDKLRHRAESVD
ncbi:hypothetical protein QS463_25925 [Escherichia coli]|nr:hypothetical protein [Escherichia coli]